MSEKPRAKNLEEIKQSLETQLEEAEDWINRSLITTNNEVFEAYRILKEEVEEVIKDIEELEEETEENSDE